MGLSKAQLGGMQTHIITNEHLSESIYDLIIANALGPVTIDDHKQTQSLAQEPQTSQAYANLIADTCVGQ